MLTRKLLLAVAGLAMSAAVALTPPNGSARAAESGGTGGKIAVVDMNIIRQQAAATLDINAQIERFRKEFQQDIQKEEAELRDANQELARKRNVLTPEAFNEERRTFEKRLIEVQRKVQIRKQELAQAQNEAMQEVTGVLAQVVEKIASENNIILILRKNQTILVAKQLEITAEVLEELNKRLPKVKVKMPKPAAGQ